MNNYTTKITTILRRTLLSLVVAGSIGLGFTPVPQVVWNTVETVWTTVSHEIRHVVGAEQHTATMPHRATYVPEDSPDFDCRIDGNQICGPGNAQGVNPGNYGY